MLGEQRLDDLRERGEDGVRQLRDDQADQACGPVAELLGTFVAEEVQRSEHCLARLAGDTGLPVQDARDRRSTDAGLFGEICETGTHVGQCR
ncbi:hypothetical protein D3C74_408520 [compost metagenome]